MVSRASFAGAKRELEGQPHRAARHVEIMGERMADDFRLLVDFLGHEMAVVALVR